VAVLVVLCLGFLVAFLGLALNVGHILVARAELQNAADAAALNGALQLNGTAGRVTTARTSACAADIVPYNVTYAAARGNPGLVCGAGDVTTGSWNLDSGRFTASNLLSLPSTVTTVRVCAARDADHGSRLPVYLSSLVGMTGADVRSRPAYAFRGGPCVGRNAAYTSPAGSYGPPYLAPFVIPESALGLVSIGTWTASRCDAPFNVPFQLSSTSNQLSVNFLVPASFRMSPLTAGMPADMRATVTGALGAARNGAGTATVGPRSNVRTVVVDSAPLVPLGQYAAALNALIGRTVRVPVRRAAGGWSGTATIAGFATMTFGGCNPFLWNFPNSCTASSTTIWLQLGCGQVDATQLGACANYGTWAQPVVVQQPSGVADSCG
jgi:Flp pilus assembly protein TadG